MGSAVTGDGGLVELLQAAHKGDLARVMELHALGANLDACDEEGWSALIEAAKGGQLQMTKELLRLGAAPNPSKVAHTALRGAAIFGHADIVEELLRAGADPNLVSLHDRTPLMGAAMKGHTNVASILVCAGANLSAVNAHGETALDVAKASGHSETAAFLATAALIQGIDKGESRVGAAAFQEWAAAGVAQSAINLTLSGRTPLDAAVGARDEELMALLIAAGGTRGAPAEG